MNGRKAALWGVGTLLAVLAVMALALRLLVDPERLKRAARDKAHGAWERELLMGDVEFHLLPLPSLRAAKVSFANPSWAREPHLLQAENVRADLELLPLLAGKVRIKSLALDGVTASLEVAENGSVSWELKDATAGRGATPPATDDDALRIGAVHIRNARIAHRKHSEASEPWLVQEASVESQPGQKGVRVEAQVVRHGRPLRVKAQFADLSQIGRKGAATEGRAELDWGPARLVAEGRFPLEKSLHGQDLHAALEATSLQEMLAFFGFQRGKGAPLEIRLKTREVHGRIEARDIKATLGPLLVTGTATFVPGSRPTVHARLQAERLDWLKTLVDAGGEVKPPRRDGEIFHPDPVAWSAISTLAAMRGTADLSIRKLRLGNGLQLANVRGTLAFGDGRMELKPFSADLLGGAATASMEFDTRRKSLRFALDGDKLLLERWFGERGSKVPFSGGPMKVKARLALTGSTYRELAASTSGRFSIRMGKGRWDSPRAGEAEEVMVRALQPKDSGAIAFECAAANLEFKSGRASGGTLIAARSDVAQLLTAGHVDLREERLDLRGKVYSRSGSRIGLASIASDVQIEGKLARPTMQLDPDARPAMIARAGAAIATAGASLIGAALVDVVETKNNPCDAVFR